jgi:hypothetical protein
MHFSPRPPPEGRPTNQGEHPRVELPVPRDGRARERGRHVPSQDVLVRDLELAQRDLVVDVHHRCAASAQPGGGEGKAARTDVAAVDDGQVVRHLCLPRHVDALDPDAPGALADAVRPEARPALDISPRARS